MVIIDFSALFHITVQTNTGKKHFLKKDARNMYEQVVTEAHGKYTFALISLEFCENWIDLYIRPEKDANLSRIMQWIQSRFAERWNKKRKTFGSVWRARFWSEIVQQADTAVKWMKRYSGRNYFTSG